MDCRGDHDRPELDGFDVLAISFAAPGIAKEWNIDRAALGIILSTELLGMSLGSLVLGGLADRAGRRRTILVCLLIMAVGMLGALPAVAALMAGGSTIAALAVWALARYRRGKVFAD